MSGKKDAEKAVKDFVEWQEHMHRPSYEFSRIGQLPRYQKVIRSKKWGYLLLTGGLVLLSLVVLFALVKVYSSVLDVGELVGVIVLVGGLGLLLVTGGVWHLRLAQGRRPTRRKD